MSKAKPKFLTTAFTKTSIIETELKISEIVNNAYQIIKTYHTDFKIRKSNNTIYLVYKFELYTLLLLFASHQEKDMEIKSQKVRLIVNAFKNPKYIKVADKLIFNSIEKICKSVNVSLYRSIV